MNQENTRKKASKGLVYSAKECAYLAVFVALVIAAQLALSALPSVELVTVLFCAYAFAFGIRRGLAAATAFSLLRQLLFGFYPTVLLLYLTYYNFLALVFAVLGKKIKKPLRFLPLLIVCACACTVVFTMTDNLLTPLWYGYSARAARAYFLASLPFLGTQLISVSLSVGVLFFPLYRVFSLVKRTLR